MANMDNDSRHLLIPEVDHEINPGPMNIQFDSSDLRSKRPFYIEPTNIVSVNEVIQKVSDHASAMNKRIHYYSRLTAPADKALIAPDHVVPAPEECYVYSPLGSAYKLQGYAEGYDFIHHINDTDAVLSTNDSNPVICPSAGNGGHPDNGSMIFYANDTGLQQFEKWWNKSKTVPLYLIGLLLPLLNFKSPSFFSKFNILGTVSVVYLIFLVTLKAIRLGFHLEFHWFTPTEFFVPEIRFQFPQLTGVLTLAFFIHNCIITLLKNNKNQENNVRDLSIAYMLVTLTYLYIGILVFASFPSPPLPKECIEQNFLDNFPSSDILSFIARIFLLFQMMTVYPLLGYLARVQLLGHIFGDVYPRYSGAACGLAFVFIYPSLTYIISPPSFRLTWPKLIFHVFIIILGVANLISQFFM
ncbi:Putative sodium-coupled neutral amino acid transporter 9 [Pteropus alecto]|uniref:Neutral amino acid transporter 9 n=1 Tax=Pteropus alecto TaxID=9402 RepID=L5KKL8_PTEAL|nr:Putative sodium-coupled neutral amino acid transporter 9 [Pteropus alecto]